jgi:hypothetical protein
MRCPPVSNSSDAWREGDVLVMRRGASPPSGRCVKCNAPAAGTPVEVRLVSSPYGQAGQGTDELERAMNDVTVLLTLRRATVALPLCARHHFRRKLGVALICVGISLSIACAFPAVATGDVRYSIGVIVFFLAGPLVGAPFARIPAAGSITDEEVRLTGVCADYLASLPPRRD